jgi:hypothetical protein
MAASPHTREYWESQQNGGFEAYPVRTTNRPFVAKKSRTVTVASGQVLKARSFVKSNTAGKMVAGGNITEFAKLVMSGTAVNTDTVIMGSLTLTASATMTAVEITEAFLSQSTTKGAFTGTLTGWELVADPNSTSTLYAYSTTGLSDVTDFVVTGTANTGTPTLTTTVTTVAASLETDSTGAVYLNTVQKPSGILAFDVDATSADTVATIYTEVYAYESEIVWGVDVANDVVVKSDGTEVACTAYNTGAVTPLLRQLYVEGTEFEIVTPTAGEELANG